MKVASPFAALSAEDLKALLDGGTLAVYSVGRPESADSPVDRSALLASFTFASPAFGVAADGAETPLFVENPVPALVVGTPGFARACRADGTPVADFSAGPGNREIRFAEVSCSEGAPVRLTLFRILDEASWPEQPEYFYGKPKPGYPLPSHP